MVCNNCGKMMIGDGATEPIRCEDAEEWDHQDPNCNPINCTKKGSFQNSETTGGGYAE